MKSLFEQETKSNLRRCINEIFERWQNIKYLMRNDFNVAMSQTSEKIENEKIAIEHAY